VRLVESVGESGWFVDNVALDVDVIQVKIERSVGQGRFCSAGL
jgi:hypothetical protein